MIKGFGFLNWQEFFLNLIKVSGTAKDYYSIRMMIPLIHIKRTIPGKLYTQKPHQEINERSFVYK